MLLNQAGRDLIKKFESCKLEVYKDIVGLNTVGWGQRTNLPVGTCITQEQADDMLENTLTTLVAELIPLIHIDLDDNQFSAIVCMVYNIGVTAFSNSSMLKIINAGGIKPAAEQFEKWDHAGGVEVPGLLRRRLAEKRLYLS